ncbi:unnamed protein product [Vitrella brassicaformis CCMP3155]|uniref:Uncharacterized protein n=1 Tax=Vitrella brassicaformis (strain CCMP3155) TaxID=1169540 RepID=A0A0G4H2B3_VITBC|nr:unnamed protein product [Vitrella brassicaformis CCMP3155]|eukprot:CEM37782.1 unnamed protein product [Vitrella brassicaformis CCMP3155]
MLLFACAASATRTRFLRADGSSLGALTAGATEGAYSVAGEVMDALSKMRQASYHTLIGTAVLVLTAIAMLTSGVVFGWLTYSKSAARVCGVLTTSIVAIAGAAYVLMSLGYGVTAVGGRELYYARYADWLVTTLLLLVDILLFAGVSWKPIVALCTLDVLMIGTGFLAVIVSTTAAKWSLYLSGVACLLPIAMILYQEATDTQLVLVPSAIASRLPSAAPTKVPLLAKTATAKEGADAVLAAYRRATLLTLCAWVSYPVVWVLGEGLFVLPLDMEILAYAALDVMSKVVLGFVLLTDFSLSAKDVSLSAAADVAKAAYSYAAEAFGKAGDSIKKGSTTAFETLKKPFTKKETPSTTDSGAPTATTQQQTAAAAAAPQRTGLFGLGRRQS